MCAFYFEPPLSEARGGGGLGWTVQSCAVLPHLLSASLGRWDFLLSPWLQSPRTCTKRGEGLCCCACRSKDYPGFIIDKGELCSGEIPMTFRRLPRINAHHVVCTNRPSNWPLRLNYEVVYERGWAWLLARDVHVHLKTTNNNGVVVEW